MSFMTKIFEESSMKMSTKEFLLFYDELGRDLWYFSGKAMTVYVYKAPSIDHLAKSTL